MKKFNLSAIIFTVLFLSVFFTNKLQASGLSDAGDKWKINSASGPSSCHLGGQEVGFRIQLKNTGDLKSTGENVTIKIYITYNGHNLGGQDFAFTPGKISPGKTATFNALVNNENISEITKTAGSKSISVSFELVSGNNLSKTFTIKVK